MAGDGGNIYRKKSNRANGAMKTGTDQFLKAKRESRDFAKHDTESGLTKAQQTTISQLEDKHSTRRSEYGFIVGADGKILADTGRGTSSSAGFDMRKLIGKDLNNAVLTHNHPKTTFGDLKMGKIAKYFGVKSTDQASTGIGSRIGTSFSDADIQTASKYNMKGIRARTENWVFNLERKGSTWGASHTELSNAMRQAYVKHRDAIRAQTPIGLSPARQREYQGRMEALASHRAMTDVAKKYGLKYTRRKVK